MKLNEFTVKIRYFGKKKVENIVEEIRKLNYRLAFFVNDLTCKITAQSIIAQAGIAPKQHQQQRPRI